MTRGPSRPVQLTRRGQAVAALLILAALLFSPQPAHAATVTYPRCITTNYAAHRYHQPKTPRHTTCVVHGTNGPAYGSIGYGGAMVTAFSPDWYPSSWASIGVLSDRDGNVTGLLVRSS